MIRPQLKNCNKSIPFCSFFILVDIESPVFANQQLKNVSKVIYCTDPTTVSWDEPSVNDNSGVYTLSSDFNPGDRFPVDETTMVTYVATDAAGNNASISFVVTLAGKRLGINFPMISTVCWRYNKIFPIVRLSNYFTSHLEIFSTVSHKIYTPTQVVHSVHMNSRRISP